jgi:tetratricopeptide (TPR) repeat protein
MFEAYRGDSMEKRSETFGRLLKAGLNSIATVEGKTGPVVDDEIGALVSLAPTSLQRYRSGYLPTDHTLTARFAEACVVRGLMGRPWLEQFLRAARFPAFEAQVLVASLFRAAPAPARTPAPRPNLPPPTFSRFIMRHEAYHAVLDGLASNLPLTAIISMGGMGKTSLARVVAGDCLEGRALPAFATAVWVSDKDRPGTTSLSTLLDEVARVLDYPGVAALSFAEKQREVETLLRAQPVLVVLDNAETVTDLALLEWLARLPTPSKTLLTSRALPPAHLPACLVDLPPLDAAQARELIAERAQRSALARLPGALDQLRPLAEAAGGNPKAIELAIGLAQRRPIPEVIAALETARLDGLFAELFARAWALLDAPAARLLLALTLFPTSAAEQALSYTVDLPEAAFQRAVERLAELSLLDIERTNLHAPPRYAAHPLVRAFVTARLAERPEEAATLRRRWLAWCADLADATSFSRSWHDLDRLMALDPEHETVQGALEWAAAQGLDRETLRLCEGVRYYYNVRGLWDERRMANYDRRAAAARRLSDRSELVLALTQHGEVLSKQATLAEAGTLLAEAEAEAAGGGVALSTDAAFEIGHARGLLAHARGDLQAAEAHWRALLPLSATLDAQKRVINRRWLATCLLDQGRVAEAEALYRESLELARSANDARSVTGNTLKLAAIDLGRGDLAAAEAALAECYAVASRYSDRRRLAEYHRLTARLCAAQGNNAGARQALAAAADLFARMGMRREAVAVKDELDGLSAQIDG